MRKGNQTKRGYSCHENCERRKFRQFKLFAIGVLAWIAYSPSVWPQESSADLSSQSLEDLMNIEVTSVSRKQQKLSETAAAVFVITQDDIRRSGATNIPELFRMVPGMDVEQISADTWAISVRGFNGQFSNKLLVMVDGRTVYTPTFSGVYWDTLDIPLEDIDRIEVIRGPGGSVWGANAVNGVIDIIQKKSADTQGGMVTALGGNVYQGAGTIQYGGKLSRDTNYRVFGRYFNDTELPSLSGAKGIDGWHMSRAGFRVDSTVSSHDKLTLEGDLYIGREGAAAQLLPSVTSPNLTEFIGQTNLAGGYLQGMWQRSSSNRSDSTLQISYDHYNRGGTDIHEARGTFAMDFQNHIALSPRHDFIWGLGYLYTGDQIDGGFSISYVPSDRGIQLFSSFIQDQIAIVPARFYLTLGTKLEHNVYTGIDALPTARISWTFNDHHSVWAAFSRAVRTPARGDTALRFNLAATAGPGGIPLLLRTVGNPNFQNEGLLAYEFGYRTVFSDRLSLDLASYFNQYDGLSTSEPGTPFFENSPAPPHLVEPIIFKNLMHGETHGLEIFGTWKVSDRWTISPGYAFEAIHLHISPQSQDTQAVPTTEGVVPAHQAQIRSHFQLLKPVSLESAAYFVDRLRFGSVPSYTRLDTGLLWTAWEGVSVGVFGQNLLKDHHAESNDGNTSVQPSVSKRGGYVQFMWRF